MSFFSQSKTGFADSQKTLHPAFLVAFYSLKTLGRPLRLLENAYLITSKVVMIGMHAIKKNEEQPEGFLGRVFKLQYDRQTIKLSRINFCE